MAIVLAAGSGLPTHRGKANAASGSAWQDIPSSMTARLITPRRFADDRGWFCETFHAARYAELGIAVAFCQDNQSMSYRRGTLRGLHFQREPHAQAKLVRCVSGRVFDVVVDVRRDSPTFGQWAGAELTSAVGEQMFVPAGYAHGFLTLEDECEVGYKVDSFYAPDSEGGIAWDDPQLAIDWPLDPGERPLLSAKDSRLPTLAAAEVRFAYDGAPLRALSAA
jgi:dTDP-4-dehydrorhamnose 3,5-epimerase